MRRLTARERLALFGGFAICLAAFATITELVVHQWLGLTQTPVAGAALLFFGGWWILAAVRRVGTLSMTTHSTWHPTLLAYATSLPQVAALAFLVILISSGLFHLLWGW